LIRTHSPALWALIRNDHWRAVKRTGIGAKFALG
jgi:hypothetical protein